MVDEIEIMPGGDRHGTTSSLRKPVVRLVKCLVNIHKGIDNSVSMSRWSWNILKHNGQGVGCNVLEINMHIQVAH